MSPSNGKSIGVDPNHDHIYTEEGRVLQRNRKYQPFPKCIYRLSDGAPKLVNNEAELDAALAKGYTTAAPNPNAAAAVVDPEPEADQPEAALPGATKGPNRNKKAL